MQARFALSSLLTAAACLYGAAPASAQGNTGFYLEGNLGYAFPESVDASASGIDGEVELKDAFVFGGALGYRFPWVRLELNGSYRKFDTDKVKAQGQSVSGNGDATAVVGLFNVRAPEREACWLTPVRLPTLSPAAPGERAADFARRWSGRQASLRVVGVRARVLPRRSRTEQAWMEEMGCGVWLSCSHSA
jgi:hypothetical protein